MPVINTNVASIQARSNFERVQREMDQSIARLSSGKRINTAADDAAYLRRLIETVQARWPVDPRRVYVLGHSNGGYMSHRMACEHADLVAGIVSLAGAAFDDPVNIDPALARCKPSEPVHILEIHGEEDGTVLYAGGRPVNTPSARETVAGWAVRNGKKPDRLYIYMAQKTRRFSIRFRNTSDNGIRHLTRNSQMSNLMSVPTDCPQRERVYIYL